MISAKEILSTSSAHLCESVVNIATMQPLSKRAAIRDVILISAGLILLQPFNHDAYLLFNGIDVPLPNVMINASIHGIGDSFITLGTIELLVGSARSLTNSLRRRKIF